MNNQEAKFILKAFRPHGIDATAPQFTEALEHARKEPSVADWFDSELKTDAQIAGILRSVEPPKGLRDAILAGGRMSRQRAWWRQTEYFAIAAMFVALLSVGAFWLGTRPANHGADLAYFAMEDVQKGHHTTHVGGVGQLKTLLTDANPHLEAGLPLDFAELQNDGCRTLNFAGHEVLEVCFQRSGKIFHLYIASRNSPGQKEDGGKAVFNTKSALASASWSDARNNYVLVTDAGRDALEQLL